MSGTKPTAYPLAPYFFGLALILCGVVALVVSIWQYHWGLKYLWHDFETIAGAGPEPKKTPVIAVAVALAIVGIGAFFAVLFRIG
jgi:putative membrane protein